jgi:hypothetical protein
MNDPAVPSPARRVLRAFAYDPLFAELNDTIVSVDVPFEPLFPGPVGALVKVVDYDPARDCWYSPVDLDDPLVLAQDGLAPSEADPRFHQQMVYAVASSVLERLERALGRRFRFGRDPLVVYPHAFLDQNAYYDPDKEHRGLFFGYFPVDPDTPGHLLPDQWVYTCLSHDIIAHELTHAVVDRLRPQLMMPTNHDVAAFHEAFADLVALFHHFTLPDLVRRHLQATRGDIASAAPLVDLAAEFGEAAGFGPALRSGVDEPDPGRLARTLECHDRGAILVGAVFSAFLDTYKTRIADLLRIATGGTGELAPGSLHPDLVARLASEATTHANRVLTMCVRAIDYLPVVDVTFGDFLRALVTADRALFPTDGSRLRATLIESFRRRGIYPDSVGSLSEQGLSWPIVNLPAIRLDGMSQLVRFAAEDFDLSTRATTADSSVRRQFTDDRRELEHKLATGLHDQIAKRPAEFGFVDSAELPIAVRGFHASFRNSEDGQPRVDVAIQATQHRPDLEELPDLADTGLTLHAGTTIVSDPVGRIRHVVTKPLPATPGRRSTPGGQRLQRIIDFVEDRDALDAVRPWTNQPNRITTQLSLANIHRGRGTRV